MKKTILTGLCALSLVIAFSSQAPAVNYQQILAKIDELTNFDNTDFSATITIVDQKVAEAKSVTRAKMFRRDRLKKFTIIIDIPEVQRGQGYLREGDNVWFYDPNTREFSFSSLKERFSDSGANNDDFASSSLAEDYKVAKGEEGTLGKNAIYILTLEATKKTATYPMLRLFVTRDQFLILKQEEYSLSKQLMRTSLFTDYQRVSGRFVPLKQLFIDNLTDDKSTPQIEADQTQMTLAGVSLGKIPDEVFTKIYLERVSN